jgi:ABC-type multidrug transport system fused ATPase/permease subunit
MFAAEFGVGQVLWSLVWFFLFLTWIVLFFNVVVDVFRSSDLSGVAKAVWVLVLVVLPYLGVFIYLIARGGKMQERSMRMAEAQEAAAQDYIRNVAGSSPAQEIERLEALRSRGSISDDEFAALKGRILTDA